MMLLTAQERKHLSKFMSLVLRHEPERHGVHLEAEGYAPLTDLLAAIQRRRDWRSYTEAHVREVVVNCEKQRYEIQGEKIRARYGHSVEEQITYEPIEPPEILYHGTTPEAWRNIQTEGLKPMGRQYSHHSTYVEQAQIVGRRHCPRPVIIRIQAQEAWKAGVQFYQPEPRMFLSTAIPPQFLTLDN